MNRIWYFAYGQLSDINKLDDLKIKIYDKKIVRAKGYHMIHNRYTDNKFSPVANLGYDTNGMVTGLAILIEDKDLKKIEKHEDYPKTTKKINVVVDFINDKYMKPENAITYIYYDEKKPMGRTEYGITTASLKPSIIKNQTKNLEWNTTSNTSYVRTFEEYKFDENT